MRHLGMPALLRAAEAMPGGATAWDIEQFLIAALPGDDPEPAAEAAAELLRVALAGASRPLPLLRMAEAALHVASSRMAFTAWHACGRPQVEPGADMDASKAWRRAQEARLAAGLPEVSG